MPQIGSDGLKAAAPATKLITAKTKRGRRILERRAPKAVSDGRLISAFAYDASIACIAAAAALPSKGGCACTRCTIVGHGGCDELAQIFLTPLVGEPRLAERNHA